MVLVYKPQSTKLIFIDPYWYKLLIESINRKEKNIPGKFQITLIIININFFFIYDSHTQRERETEAET